MNEEVKNSFSDEDNNEERKKKNLFNIIIGIATLLIAILGATFAYFSASATSDENDVNLRSAYLSISYDGGTKIKADELIPASLNVALTEYQNRDGRRCVDINGKQVCYVYQFTISSDVEDDTLTDIIGSIKINTNGFDNLSYLLYEVTFDKDENGNVIFDENTLDENGDPIESVSSYNLIDTNFTEIDTNDDIVASNYEDIRFNKFLRPVDNYDGDGNLVNTTYPVACLFGYADDYESKSIDDASRCSKLSVTNSVNHTYQLVVWLEETGVVQHEQAKEFAGTVSIDVSSNMSSSGYEDGRITGRLG